jgi:hypothetical protein
MLVCYYWSRGWVFPFFVAAVWGCFDVFVRQKFVIYWPNVDANEMKLEKNGLARGTHGR